MYRIQPFLFGVQVLFSEMTSTIVVVVDSEVEFVGAFCGLSSCPDTSWSWLLFFLGMKYSSVVKTLRMMMMACPKKQININ